MPPVVLAVATVAAVATGSKFLKTVSSIGLQIAGYATGNLALVALGKAVGSSALSSNKQTAPSPENANRLRANIDVRTPRKTVIGITAMATDIRDEEITGNQDYLHRFIVTSSHKAQSHDEIWFDDKMAWSAAGGVTSEFAAWLTVQVINEGSAANAINISSRMGSSRRYTGCSYVYLRYRINDSKSPFAQSITTRITIRGQGASLYDPRRDSTVAGGSGSQRADSQSTWAWDDNACRNPALALLFYLLGYRINGELAVGKGIPPERIDLESFAVAANICDETVATPGGTEPRYRCDGVWSEGDSPTTVIDMLKACMNADLDDVDGKLRLTIFTDTTFASDADFTDDDIIGKFTWEPERPLETTYNVVRGTYTDPSNASLYQQVDYPEVKETSPDGIDRIDPFNLPMAQSPYQCQRLAELRRNRQKFGGIFKAEFQATAWRVQKNSIVRLTFSRRGWVNKTFRVADIDLRVDGVVPLTLVEEDPAIYVAPALKAAVAGVNSTPYDPFKDAIVTGIDAAGKTALWPDITGTGKPADNATRNIVTYSATAPASPVNGDLWVDTSGTYAVFKLRSGGAWVTGANALSAYNALSGKPVALADINTTESSKLAGIAPGADVTSANISAGYAGQTGWGTYAGYTPEQVTTPGANLLFNSSFNIGSLGWPDGSWSGPLKAAGDVGAYYMTTNANNRYLYTADVTKTPVFPNQPYTFQVWAAANGASSGSNRPYFYIDWHRADGSPIGSSGLTFVPVNVGYLTLAVTGTSPSDAAYARVVMNSNQVATGGGAVYTSKWKLELGSSPTPWTDEATNGALYQSGQTIDSLKPAQANADVTGLNISAGFVGQQRGATSNSLADLDPTAASTLASLSVGSTQVAPYGSVISKMIPAGGSASFNGRIQVDGSGSSSGTIRCALQSSPSGANTFTTFASGAGSSAGPGETGGDSASGTFTNTTGVDRVFDFRVSIQRTPGSAGGTVIQSTSYIAI